MRDEPRQVSCEAEWCPEVEAKGCEDGAQPDQGLWPPMRQPSRLDVAQQVDAGEARSPQSFTGIRDRPPRPQERRRTPRRQGRRRRRGEREGEGGGFQD